MSGGYPETVAKASAIARVESNEEKAKIQRGAAATAKLLDRTTYNRGPVPVYVFEDRLKFAGDVAGFKLGTDSNIEIETAESTISYGKKQAGRTLDEALRIVTKWSSQPGGWSDAARTDRWHTAGRREDEM